jgi:ACT domain-containing protein
METAVIIAKESFDLLLKKIDNLSSEVISLKKEVRKSEKLYNITESAKKMGISKATLFNYLKLGLVECKHVGNSRYFTQELIDDFISKKQ